MQTRPLRADARRNRDRLLAVAVRAFSQDGPDVPAGRDRPGGRGRDRHPLPALPDPGGAGRGGVPDRAGPALRRRARCCSRRCRRTEALRAWMDRFVDYMTTKRGWPTR